MDGDVGLLLQRRHRRIEAANDRTLLFHLQLGSRAGGLLQLDQRQHTPAVFRDLARQANALSQR
jgi:hypothetical protein